MAAGLLSPGVAGPDATLAGTASSDSDRVSSSSPLPSVPLSRACCLGLCCRCHAADPDGKCDADAALEGESSGRCPGLPRVRQTPKPLRQIEQRLALLALSGEGEPPLLPESTAAAVRFGAGCTNMVSDLRFFCRSKLGLRRTVAVGKWWVIVEMAP